LENDDRSLTADGQTGLEERRTLSADPSMPTGREREKNETIVKAVEEERALSISTEGNRLKGEENRSPLYTGLKGSLL